MSRCTLALYTVHECGFTQRECLFDCLTDFTDMQCTYIYLRYYCVDITIIFWFLFSPKCFVSNLLMKKDSRHFRYKVDSCLQFSIVFIIVYLCNGQGDLKKVGLVF